MRPIDADALYREVKTECNPYGKPTIGFDDGKKVLELIDAAPTIETEPVRHGHWINDTFCSECKRFPVDVSVPISNQQLTKYFSRCPHCGSRMD